MTDAILLKGGRLIDPKNHHDGICDLLLQAGKVARVDKQISDFTDLRVIDVRGKWVVPGFIDLHVHLREPGEESKETILSGSRAAVSGGYTAIVAMPNTKTVNDNPQVTEFVLNRAREANLCRVYPAGAISKGLKGEEMAEMGQLVEAGCVCVTDDGRPIMNAALMRRALQYAKAFSIPVMVHEEDLNLSRKGLMTEGARATRMGLLPIPPSAEVAMVARDLVLAEECGGRLHIAHLSCAGSVRLVREAQSRGIRVTAEVTPHHFSLTDSELEGYNTHAKMNPPLRQMKDLDAIREAMIDGTLCAIATDHAPHGVLDKQVEFEKAANGIVGLETALPLTLELVHQGILSITRAIELLTSGPAEAFGLPGGHLSVGAPADVTVVDPEAKWQIDARRFYSKSRNSPFDGRQVRGRVTDCFVGGRQVLSEGIVEENRR